MTYAEQLSPTMMLSGCATALGVVLLGVKLGADAPFRGPSQVAYSAIFGIAFALALTAAARWVRTSWLEGEAVGLSAMAFVGWSAPMAFGSLSALNATIAGDGPSPEDAGMMAVGAAVVTLPWSLLVPRFGVVRLGRLMTRAAPWVVGVGALLVAAALVRSVMRPDPDRWIARTPTAARVSPGETALVNGTELRYVKSPPLPVPMSTAPPQPGVRPMTTVEESCAVRTPQDDIIVRSRCAPLELAHDERTDLWFFRDVGADRTLSSVFRAPSDRFRISAASIARGVAPPVGWIAGAGGGLVCALLALVLARRRSRAAQEIPGTDAGHLGGGRVTLLTGETVDVPSALHAPLGDVRIELPAQGADYRASPHAGVRYVGPGSVATVRRRLEASARGAALAAVAIVVVTMMPLAVAAAKGLVIGR